MTALGSYVIPKVEVQVSGTLRSDPGGQLAANWSAPNSATVAVRTPAADIRASTSFVGFDSVSPARTRTLIGPW